MSGQENMVSITVMDRSYSIKCPPEQAQALYKAANYLDAQMRKLRQSASNSTSDSLAVVAALNISHELMSYKKQLDNGADTLNQRVKSLEKKIEQALDIEETVAA
ncbi:MAG: cell division protein ZapA [Coxiellaceae bacterium]|nr:cell division protein ZapA [Coxiellaceae bacterium]